MIENLRHMLEILEECKEILEKYYFNTKHFYLLREAVNFAIFKLKQELEDFEAQHSIGA